MLTLSSPPSKPKQPYVCFRYAQVGHRPPSLPNLIYIKLGQLGQVQQATQVGQKKHLFKCGENLFHIKKVGAMVKPLSFKVQVRVRNQMLILATQSMLGSLGGLSYPGPIFLAQVSQPPTQGFLAQANKLDPLMQVPQPRLLNSLGTIRLTY